MTTLDIIVAVPLLWGAFKGYKRGLIVEIAQIAALVLGFMAGSKLSFFLYSWLAELFNIPERMISLVAFILIFIAVVIAVFLLAKIVTGLLKAVALGLLNRLAGMLLGIIKFALLAGVLLYCIVRFDKNMVLLKQDVRQNSVLFNPLMQTTEFCIPFIQKMISGESKENKQASKETKKK